MEAEDNVMGKGSLMEVDEKTLLQLDFFRIRAAIAGCCCSLEGQQLVESRLPLTNPAEITRLKEEASQWVTYLNSARPLPLAGWEPVAPVAEVLSVANSVLSQQELHTLATFCAITIKTAAALKSAASQLPLPRLAEYAQSMPDLSQPAALIGHVLDKGG